MPELRQGCSIQLTASLQWNRVVAHFTSDSNLCAVSAIGYWTRQHTDKITHNSMWLHICILYSPVPRCSEQSGDNQTDDNVVLQHVSSLGLLCCRFCKPLLSQMAGPFGWGMGVWGSPDYFIKRETYRKNVLGIISHLFPIIPYILCTQCFSFW